MSPHNQNSWGIEVAKLMANWLRIRIFCEIKAGFVNVCYFGIRCGPARQCL